MRLPREEQELSSNGFNGAYTLPSVAEMDDEASLQLETPLLVGGESYEFAAIANLDLFFTRVYRYWHERGLSSILLAGALNLMALAFTAAFSTFLLLFVDWRALHAECLAPRAGGGGDSGGSGRSCDLSAVALDRRPLLGRGLAADMLAVSYISVCVVYLGWTAAHYVMDARDMREVAHFMANKLGISESKVVTMTWAEVVHRLVLVQRTTRLCIARDLDELHIVSRIMRKENYLIAMINRDVLQLHLQPPADAPPSLRRALGAVLRLLGGGSGGGGCGGGRGSPPMLTKTLEWNLRWCILDHMFDERFRIRPEFSDVEALKRRLRLVAAANLLLSPFLFMFLMAYFFMRNAERLYHHPAALGSRRWSGLAKWRIRELNELPHYLHHRLSASHPAALRYVAQFPSHTLAALARFMVFVTGSFVALLLLVTFLDDSLLERPLLGRQVVWWLGTMTVVLAACRTLVSEEPVAYDPERALADVVSYTHYLPRHWRGRAHTAEVQAAFLSLFRLKVGLFLEEVTSLVTTPLVLACSLPACADSIVEFVSTFTAHVDGVGDVCSMGMFDLWRHGNSKYGSPVQAEKAFRSRQGKLEKSFLTFVATYPTWEPEEMGRRMLAALAAANGGGSGGAAADDGASVEAAAAPPRGATEPRPAADALPFHQEPPTVFPYQAAGKAAADGGGAAAAAAAASAAALTRGVTATASGFRHAAAAAAVKGGSAAAVATTTAVGQRVDDGVGGAGTTEGLVAAAATLPPPPPPLGRLPPGASPQNVRRPPLPLHLQPYHGVRSYTSNASASHISAGGGGWPMRLPGYISGGGGGAAGVPAGGSPPPSVASSQFSNLTAPYLQYYPVPFYYVRQQQLRHVRQQQYQRMYEHLMYGAAPGGSGPMGRGMANSTASVAAAAGGGAAAAGPRGEADWLHHSLPQPYNMYGSAYSGSFQPFPFDAAVGMPLSPGPRGPSLIPHSHLNPQPRSWEGPRSPAGGSPAGASGGAGGGGGGGSFGLHRPMGRPAPPAGGSAAGAPAPVLVPMPAASGAATENAAGGVVVSVMSARPEDQARHTGGSSGEAHGRQPPPPEAPLQPPGAPMAAALPGVEGGEGRGLAGMAGGEDAVAAKAATAAAGPAAAGAAAAVRAGGSGTPEAGADGWGSGVSGLSDRAGCSREAVKASSAAGSGGSSSTAAGGAPVGVGASSGSAGGGTSSLVAGSGSAVGVGYGSDILDMRGVELAPPPTDVDDDDEDPLGVGGGFVELPAAAPEAAAAAPPPKPQQAGPAPGQATGIGGLLEEADGFGLVPGAAAGSSREGLMPRRWGPVGGSGAASRVVAGTAAGLGHSAALGPPAAAAAAAWVEDRDGASSGVWYDREMPYGGPQDLRHLHHHHHRQEQEQGQGQGQGQDQGDLDQEQPQQYSHVLDGDPSSSQMYYSADYYGMSPYYGIDEYGMYGYDSSMPYGDGTALGPPPQPLLLPVQEPHGAGQHQHHHCPPHSLQPPHLQPPPPPPPPLSQSQLSYEHMSYQQRHQHQQPTQGWRQADTATAAAADAPSAASLRASLFGGDAATTAAESAAGAPPPTQPPQGPGLLPLNETSELRERVAQGHALLQSLYETSDLSVQHRMLQQRHVRSIHAAAGTAGGAGGAAGGGGFTAVGSESGRSGYGHAA